jgi:hypothetical protein
MRSLGVRNRNAVATPDFSYPHCNLNLHYLIMTNYKAYAAPLAMLSPLNGLLVGWPPHHGASQPKRNRLTLSCKDRRVDVVYFYA